MATSTAQRAAHRIAGPPLVRMLRPTVTGRAYVPTTGGAVLAANHASNLDNYLLSAACPRPVSYLGKDELARGLFGAWNRAMGMVPVARGGADTEALAAIVAVVRAGGVVALFPEGSRSTTGALFRFRSGLARIAYATDAPVVPVGLRGTAQVWPRGGRPAPRRPAAGVLAVHFGAPMPPPTASQGRARRTWTAQVRARVAELSGQPLENRFAETTDDGV